ncbi:MAG: hypothetical protein OEY31_07545, partial [Candidatus Bathyarchaeota archaeon]|nr:hypothetical protein [Candidatus Bathyarchaeota archaeon]
RVDPKPWISWCIRLAHTSLHFMSLFIMRGHTLWNLILHAPLLFISMYGLLIARRLRKNTFPDLNC